jgi:hypothetical protein
VRLTLLVILLDEVAAHDLGVITVNIAYAPPGEIAIAAFHFRDGPL